MNGKRLTLLTTLVLLVLSFCLSGCFDLGDFGGDTNHKVDNSDYEEVYKSYYDAFDKIHLISQDKHNESYSLKDSFFNPTTVNNLTWEKSEYEVSTNEYLAMYFKCKKDIYLDELSLFVKCSMGENEASKQLNIYFYIVSSDAFGELYAYNDTFDKDKTYDIKDKATAIGSATVSLSNGTWGSFSIKSFKENGEMTYLNYYKVESGQYLLLSFYNNSGYGKDEKLEKVNFTCTNLLIRAVSEEVATK